MKPVFFLCLIASSLADPRLEKRIIAGGPAALFAHPHQVSIQLLYNDGEWRHMCGGSLLCNTKVLTAAHCLKGLSVTELRVILGATDFNNPNIYAQIIAVSSFVIHENYSVVIPALDNDIGIITLSQPATLNKNVQVAVLAINDSAFVDTKCTISGWGYSSKSPDILPSHLQEVNMTVISTANCQSGWPLITTKHVCVLENSVAPGSRPSPCQGDSGGPLMCGDNATVFLVGVTSWGLANCGGYKPSVYTRVTSYLQWIAQHTI